MVIRDDPHGGETAQLHLTGSGDIHVDDLTNGVLGEKCQRLNALVKRVLQLLRGRIILLLGAGSAVVLEIVLCSNDALHGRAKPALLRRDVQSHDACGNGVVFVKSFE